MTDPISTAAYRASIAQARQKCFAAWSRMSPEEWATEVYRLPGGRRFRWDYAPYSRAMFRSMFEPRTIETSFMLYSRGLKSTVVLIAIGYFIDQAPRPILALWPTNSQSQKWSKDSLTGELLATTTCLQFLAQTGRRIASQTLLHKAFPGGLIDIFGANAPGDMRRAKGSFLYADEIDAIGAEVTDEGDQMAIFYKRGDEYPDTIKVVASYPSLKGHSRIAAKIEQSDCNQWFSTCVKCGGEPYVMTRQMIRYEKDRPEDARMECPMCKELLTDSQRYDMAHRQGFDNWKPSNEFRGRRGFKGSAMLWPHPTDPLKCPGGALQMIAEQEIAANNSANPKRAMRVVVNTVDAEPFDPTDETEKPPEWKVIYLRREDYVRPPRSCIVLTAFVDVQVNRLEVEWKGWASDEQSFGLSHVTLDGNTRDVDVWRKRLCRELQRTFQREDGAIMSINIGLIDGGWAADYVYNFMQWLAANPVEGVTGKVRASKGIGEHGATIIDPNWRGIAKNLKGYHIGTWEAKDLINQRLRMKPDEGMFPAGYMHYPTSYGEIYFQQLCTGIPTIVFQAVKGKMEEVRKFLNESKLKDEGLDLAVGNLAAFRLRRWNFEALDAELVASIPSDEPKEEVTTNQVAVLSSGNGWRL